MSEKKNFTEYQKYHHQKINPCKERQRARQRYNNNNDDVTIRENTSKETK